ncbi:hypothetical protein AVEN_226610-1, partial [Araneus ventricosus]
CLRVAYQTTLVLLLRPLHPSSIHLRTVISMKSYSAASKRAFCQPYAANSLLDLHSEKIHFTQTVASFNEKSVQYELRNSHIPSEDSFS